MDGQRHAPAGVPPEKGPVPNATSVVDELNMSMQHLWHDNDREKHVPVACYSPQIPYVGYRHKFEPGSPS